MGENLKDILGEALDAVHSGEMNLAKTIFGELLEAYPENADILCGFYTSSYWENRSDILSARSGRESASLIMKEWDRFEAVAEEKKFLGLSSYQAAMRYILGAAAENLRHAFQTEGAGGDTELLMELSKCLIRIENYADAMEILQYARKFNSTNPKILFLLAEAYLSPEDPGQTAKGIALYRDAFFIEPAAFEISSVTSLQAGDLLKELYEHFGEDVKKTCSWFPSYLLADYFLPDMKCMKEEEISQAVSEVRRLSRDLERVVEEYVDRVRSRVAFYAMILIHYFTFQEKDLSLVREYESILEKMDSGLFERYMKEKQRK